ncbi:MAG: S9 family peptidase [Conexivisphaerales archaeon]
MLKPVAVEDFARYKSLSVPSISPDRSRIAISVHQANLEDDSYISDVWLADIDGANFYKFTNGGRDFSPKWSPDGKKLLFLSRRNMSKEEKGNALYVINRDGGEAKLVVKRKEGIESAEWCQDSTSITFLSNIVKEEQDDVRVIRRFRFWFNGSGYVYNQRKHAFKVDINSGEVKQLTSGDFDVSAAHLSHDGNRLAYLAQMDEMRPYITDLLIKDLATGSEQKITTSDMEIEEAVWSPDDKFLAIKGNKLTSGFASHSHLWLVEPDGYLHQLEAVDRNKSNSLNSDVRNGAHAPSMLLWEGDNIYFHQQDEGSAHLYRINPKEGKSHLVLGGERSIEGVDVKKNIVAFVAMSAFSLEELYVKDKSERKITSLNSDLYNEIEIIKPEKFSFRASDNEQIEGWIILPKEHTQKVPVILYIHGGPKTSFGNSFMHEFQVFASAGYAVVYMNPRGSDGYTEKFADIRGSYGKRDYQDIMEGLDYILSSHELLDADRLGVAGGSYGGFMTNWIIGHTNRFKAAVTDRSIASWTSFFGTSDIGPHFTKDQIGYDPWSNESKIAEDSPLKYLPNVRTPLLVIHSMEDYRCWLVEGLQMYTGLKYLGKEAELVLFANENHDLSRNGKPKHRVARLKHYLRWFDYYLKR